MRKIKIIKKVIFNYFLLLVFFPAVVLAQSSGFYVPTNMGLPTSQSGIAGILSNFLMWLLGIFGVIALISFVVSGIQYLMSAGDEKRMQTAKRNAVYSIIGVVVGLSGFLIVQAVDAALRATGNF